MNANTRLERRQVAELLGVWRQRDRAARVDAARVLLALPEHQAVQDLAKSVLALDPARLVQLLCMLGVGALASMALWLPSSSAALLLLWAVLITVGSKLVLLKVVADLFDSPDAKVLLSLPVSSNTLTWAKLCHVAAVLWPMLLALALVPAIAVGVRFGVFAAARFGVAAALTAVFILGVTVLGCLLMARWLRPDGLRRAVLYAVIAGYGAIVVAFRLFANELVSLAELDLLGAMGTAALLLPPAWMSALTACCDGGHAALVVTACLIPPLVMLLALKVTLRRYRQVLAAIATGSERLSGGRTNGATWSSGSISRWLWPRSDAWQAAAVWSEKIAATDFGFKLRVFPQLGMILAFAALFLLDKRVLPASAVLNSFGYFFFLYVACVFMVTTLPNLQFGTQHASAWIYRVLPIRNTRNLALAATFGIAARYVLPVALLAAVMIVVQWGLATLADVAFALSVCATAIVLQAMRVTAVPFSVNIYGAIAPARVLVDYFLVLLPVTALAVTHVLVRQQFGPLAVGAAAVLLLVAASGTAWWWRRRDARRAAVPAPSAWYTSAQTPPS